MNRVLVPMLITLWLSGKLKNKIAFSRNFLGRGGGGGGSCLQTPIIWAWDFPFSGKIFVKNIKFPRGQKPNQLFPQKSRANNPIPSTNDSSYFWSYLRIKFHALDNLYSCVAGAGILCARNKVWAAKLRELQSLIIITSISKSSSPFSSPLHRSVLAAPPPKLYYACLQYPATQPMH